MQDEKVELIDGTSINKTICEKILKEIHLVYTKAGGIDTLRKVYNDEFSVLIPYHAELMDWNWIEIEYLTDPIDYSMKFKRFNSNVSRLVKLSFNPNTKALIDPRKIE